MPRKKPGRISKSEQQKRYKKMRAEFLCIALVFAFELVLIIIAMLVGNKYERQKENCTKSVDAVVTDVKTERVRERNLSPTHGGKYKYVTETTVTISVETDSVFKEKTITTHIAHYEKDQKLKVYYDPDDPSDYYIEDQLEITNNTQIAIIVIAALWLPVCLLVTWVALKDFKRYRNGEYIDRWKL